MYNRYIPQSDGSYQRNKIPDSQRQTRQNTQQNKPRQEKEPPPPPKPAVQPPPPAPKPIQPQPLGIMNFFRQLLPKNLDTADLLIILLLLLMAGDNEEERANALLTMALYFIM